MIRHQTGGEQGTVIQFIRIIFLLGCACLLVLACAIQASLLRNWPLALLATATMLALPMQALRDRRLSKKINPTCCARMPPKSSEAVRAKIRSRRVLARRRR